MDWQNVTREELSDALGEVEWNAPRPVTEFFTKFSPPKTFSKWTSRVKCNVYYYRTNYLGLFLLGFLIPLIRNLMAVAAILMMTTALLLNNDPFASSINDLCIRVMRTVHPRTAQRMRAKAVSSDGSLGSKSRARRTVYIAGFPRSVFSIALMVTAGILSYLSAALVTLAWSSLLGVGLPVIHATLRSPNLKARLNSAKEEFRAVWRGYQAEALQDYSR